MLEISDQRYGKFKCGIWRFYAGWEEDEMAEKEFDEKYPDFAGPIEYKDAPVHFTFVLKDQPRYNNTVNPEQPTCP